MDGASRRSRRAHSAWKWTARSAAVVAEEQLDALPHLFGRFVGERDGQHFTGLRESLLIRYAMRYAIDARLSRPGAGQDQHRSVGVHDGVELRRD
jgi:hypothetical protein